MPPHVTAASLAVLEMLERDSSLCRTVADNTAYFRGLMESYGFDVIPSTHPIVPVMLYDEHVASEMAARMLEKGVYVIGFTYPVVPKGKARIRTQISAAHTKEELKFVADCFAAVRDEMGLSSK